MAKMLKQDGTPAGGDSHNCPPDSDILRKVKPNVWVLEITEKSKKQKSSIHATAFLVGGNRLMTCAKVIDDMPRGTIRARRLDEVGFKRKAEVVFRKDEWNMALLSVDGSVEEDCVELASDASLKVGDELIQIAHPFQLVGTLNIGRVLYPCENDVPIPDDDDHTCASYTPTSMVDTPPYRVLGHAWNSQKLKKTKGQHLQTFCRDLHPLVPVIQSGGLADEIQAFGSPVYNVEGKLVGMMIESPTLPFQIAIHVSAIRKFLEDAKKRLLAQKEIELKRAQEMKRRISSEQQKEGSIKKIRRS